MLGNISFWLGFGRCLLFLFAPCGCWRAYCGPLCGSESARVLASLVGSSPSGVRHLSRVCSSVWGPVGVAHPFHPSLLLGGVLVRLCGGPTRRSLAMFWACPPPFLCVGLVCPVRTVAPLVPRLCWRCPSFASSSSWGGASPHALGSVGAHGVSGGSTYIALHRSWSVSVIWPYTHWSSGRCFILPAQRAACIHGDQFVSLTGWCVSQP